LQTNEVALNESSIQTMVGFFDMYDKQATKLDDSLHVLNQEITKLQSQMDAIHRNMQEMNLQAIKETRFVHHFPCHT
jgi:uncharacterized coiled-coil protein SlyX